MTFPIQFPSLFSAGNFGSGLPITGWWAELPTGLINPDVTVSSSARLAARLSLTSPSPTATSSVGLKAQLSLANPNVAVASSVGFGLLEGLNLTNPNVTVANSAGLSARLALANPDPTVGSSASLLAQLGLANPSVAVAGSAGLLAQLSLANPNIVATNSVGLAAQLGLTNPGGAAASSAGLAAQLGMTNPNVTAASSVGLSLVYPTYDNSALSAGQSSLASGAAFTWSATATAGAYGIVLVECVANNSPPLSGTTMAVTWGGVAMTPLGSQASDNVSADGWGWVFGLSGVAGGASTISVTVTHAGDPFTGFGSSYSYNNVSAVGTLQTAYGNSASPLVSVTAANSTDVVWGAICGSLSSITGFSLTTRKTATGGHFVAGDTTGSTSVTVGATTNSSVWSAFGLDLQ